jgi:hypothetical protein
MPILIGAHPGGKNSFAVCALFWPGKLPAMLVGVRSYSGVDAVLKDIVGVFGEWGDLTAAGIAAPLSWSGTPNGWRECDLELKKLVPEWAPKSWSRSPNALPGTIGVQGPALTWGMAYETKRGLLPEHKVFECVPRVSLSRIAPEERAAVVGYRNKDVGGAAKKKHVEKLVERFVDSGVVKLEVNAPVIPEELDALVAAVSVLAVTHDETGILTRTLDGGEIRPVGKRQLVILDALP